MNEPRDTDDTAAFLNRFQPAVVPGELMQRLLTSCPGLPVAAKKPRIVTFLPRLAAAAAVMVAGGAAVWQFVPRPARQEVTTEPASSPATNIASVPPGVPRESRQQLLGIRDLGIARDTRSRPVRLMHATWLEDDISSGGDSTPPVREARVRDEIVPVLLTTY